MPSPSTSWTDPERPALGRPSPASGSEPRLRPDGDAASAAWRADGGRTEWCSVRVASVVGVRHRLAGEGTDDSYAWCHRDGVLMVAVADGIGSVPGSAGAAERACRAAAASNPAASNPAASDPAASDPAAPTGCAEAAVREAVTAAAVAAQGGGATTLVVACLRRGGEAAVARIGDSSAFLIRSDGSAVELFEPPDPDRADTATPALPMEGAGPEVRSVTVSPGEALVLVTDGVADPWRDGPATVAPVLSKGLSAAPGPLQMLGLTDFSRLGCHDDRTVLAVWPAEAPAGPDRFHGW